MIRCRDKSEQVLTSYGHETQTRVINERSSTESCTKCLETDENN